jgi:2-polyprenyl-3-methyl-5-hydroxy-6-metoxy-1,4-benzoquinol methylase
MRKVLRTVADHDPDYYDMYRDEAESFFAQLYVERISRHADAEGIRPPATLLEAGCQAGRLVIPFAKLGYAVTGMDTSGYALRRAREHARAAGVEATFVRGDLEGVLHDHPRWRYDIVVCAEVLYLSRRYREMLQALAGAVRPGGLLCVSHRPKCYYVLEALRRSGDLQTAEAVMRTAEGPFHDSAYYNWQTLEELRALYHALGLRWLAGYPIDRLAWLGGLNVAQLSPLERDRLRDLELRDPGEGCADARYLLVIASASGGVPTACRPAKLDGTIRDASGQGREG